ncbi:MAG: excisionase [Defluviitaleaceae bacterium]|nr:excisionase [Defluviitaleaceae bacterium]
MNYILMHRKKPVAELEISGKRARISAVGELYDREHLPIGVSASSDGVDIDDLNDWWQARSIPASRQNLLDALEELKMSSSSELLTKCFGLSLSDHYWISPTESPLKWQDVNFFDNTFSDDVGNALFGNAAYKKQLNLVAPENTSDGVLKKRWKIINGKRCLIKGGSDPFQQEPCNEAIATAIMERLSIEHVVYNVKLDEGLPYSVCENFLTPETELVSGFYIHNTQKMKTDNFYKHFLDCCLALGIPNAQENFDKMLVLDYLIANKDRHMNNFGAVRNAETLEWLGLAPVYDSGACLWYNQLQANAENAPCSKPFLDTHEEQIKLVRNFSWLDLSALNGMKDEIMSTLLLSPYIDEQRAESIYYAFDLRVRNLLNHVRT